VRIEGVLLPGEAPARVFREKLESGAKLRWLAEKDPAFRDQNPIVFSNSMAVSDLPRSGQTLAPGAIVGPFPSAGGWAVGTVRDVEPQKPTPFEECRGQVLAAMRSEQGRLAITTALARLESQAHIEIADGARAVVAAQLEEWLGHSRDSDTP
jgi:hypothetical protein